MAFEFNFDDDIFQESHCRIKTVPGIYSPKQCDPEWFMHFSPNDDQSEIQNIRKYQGDLLYHKHKYKQALVMYQESRQSMLLNNTVLDRELLESLAMCLLKLGKFDEALTLVKETMGDSQHNDSSMWHLLSQIYRAMGNVEGEIDALQQCATLHSWNYQYWFLLALAYEKLSASCIKCPKENFGNLDLGSKNVLWHQHLTCKRNCKERSLNVGSLQNTDLTVKLNGCFITNGRTQPEMYSRHHSSDEGKTINSQPIIIGEHDTLAGRIKSFSIKSDCGVQEQPKETVSCNRACLDSTNISPSFVSSQGKDLFVDEYFCKCQDTTKLLSVKNKLHGRNHVLSFGCLIKARFFLEKAIEASSSFAKDKCKVLLTKVNDKISTHIDCGCVNLKDKVSEMLYASFVASGQENLDQYNTGTEGCKLRENSAPDGDVAFNFEQKWFSNLLSYMSERS